MINSTIKIFILIFFTLSSLGYGMGGRPQGSPWNSGIGRGSLQFHFQSLAIHSPSGPMVEISYSFSYDQLQFVAKNGKYQGIFSISAIIYNQKGQQVAGDSWEVNLEAGNYDDLRKGSLIAADTLLLPMPAGRFRISLDLKDGNSDHRGHAEMWMEAKEKKTGFLAMTGIRFMRKMEDKNRPWPSRIYSSDNNVIVVHNRIYPAGPEPLIMEYTLRRNNKTAFVWATTDTLIPSQELTVVKLIPIDSFPGGSYRLTVKAEQSGQQEVVSESLKIRNVGMMNYSDYHDQIDPLIYLARSRELDSLRKAAPAERESLLNIFWKTRDPDTTTAVNEARERYYERLSYANENFGSIFKPGWKSDMGMIYVMFGPPDDIERHPFDIDLPAYEIWYYYQEGRKFVFMDRKGIGDYELIFPTKERILR